LDNNLRKKLVQFLHLELVALIGVETWKLRKVDKKYLVSFEMLCWIRMEIICANRVRNVEALHRVEDRNILNTTKVGRTEWFGHILPRNHLLKNVIEENMER
jgi:hypothetical protein